MPYITLLVVVLVPKLKRFGTDSSDPYQTKKTSMGSFK